MKLYSLAGAVLIALSVSECVKTAEYVCERENTLHSVYLSQIAPHRTAAQVDKAKKFHARVQGACDKGASIFDILAAVNDADSARQ